MDYEEAERIMFEVLSFVFDYMNDYPDAFENQTGQGLSQNFIEEAYNKVKNG